MEEEKGKGLKRDSTDVGGFPSVRTIDLDACKRMCSQFRPTCKFCKLVDEELDLKLAEDPDFKLLHYYLNGPSCLEPSESSLLEQSMDETDEDDWTIYRALNDCTYWVRYCADFTETMYHKAVVASRPGILVAAVGGIPHDLKINHGISFSIPGPVFRYPIMMPRDPTDYKKVRHESYKAAMESDSFIHAFVKAYMKAKYQALGISSSKEEEIEEEEEEAQRPRSVLEFNIAVSPGLRLFLRSIRPDPILSQIDMERNEDAKVVFIVESRTGSTFLYRHFTNLLEVTRLYGVMIRKRGFVAVAGGIPDELKIEGALRFWYPSPISKQAKPLSLYTPLGPQHYQCDGEDSYQVSSDVKTEWFEAFMQAFQKARSASLSTQEVDADYKNPLHPMIEVNMSHKCFTSST